MKVMKKWISLILGLLGCLTAYGQRSVSYDPATGQVLSPPNFFPANSNSINRVVTTWSKPTIAAMLTVTPDTNTLLSAQGYRTPGDGGGGYFRAQLDDGSVTNLGTIFRFPGTTNYLAKRIYSGQVNVRWFGAYADNVHDDSGAIQSAINLASKDLSYSTENGINVYIPKGTYLIQNTVNLTNGIWFHGDSSYATVLTTTLTNADVLACVHPTVTPGIDNLVHISDLAIVNLVNSNGFRPNIVAGAGIHIGEDTQQTESVIENVMIYGTFDGIHLKACEGGTIRNTYLMSHFNRYGIYVESAATYGNHCLHFASIVLGDARVAGMYVDNCSVSEITSCTFNNLDYGLVFTNCIDMKVTATDIENPTNACVKIVNCRGINLDDVTLQPLDVAGVSKDAVYIKDSFNITVHNGTVSIAPGALPSGWGLNLAGTTTNIVVIGGTLDIWGNGVTNHPSVIPIGNVSALDFGQDKFLARTDIKSSGTMTLGGVSISQWPAVITNTAAGTWGFLTITNVGTHVTLGGIGAYATVTNWNKAYLNGFTSSTVGTTGGSLTNTIAGWYRVTFTVTLTPGNSDQIEAEIAINGVNSDTIAGHSNTGNPAKSIEVSGTGVLFLPANTGVSIMIQNVNSTTVSSFDHAQLVIGTP